ncbi:MAG: hypothetical protein ACRD0J_04765 [Acidimicrobiales bacterium]
MAPARLFDLPPPKTHRTRVDPDQVAAVFDAWVEATKRSSARTLLDAKRQTVISKALVAYPLADVLDAVRGWQASPFHRGDNAQRRAYNDLSLLLRDADHIERFRDLARDQGGTRPLSHVESDFTGVRPGRWTPEDQA